MQMSNMSNIARQCEQIAQQLIQQTNQANQRYQQMLQKQQQNITALQQMMQKEQEAVQYIQQSLQGHQTAIRQLNQIQQMCRQLESSFTQSSAMHSMQMPSYGQQSYRQPSTSFQPSYSFSFASGQQPAPYAASRQLTN